MDASIRVPSASVGWETLSVASHWRRYAFDWIAYASGAYAMCVCWTVRSIIILVMPLSCCSFLLSIIRICGSRAGRDMDKIKELGLHLEDSAYVGVPGIKDEFLGRAEKLLSDWLGDESYMFQSPSVWKEIIGTSDRIDCVEVWEMECFDAAWEEWFATEHKYALGDKQFYDALIKPYTGFVGIYIKLK